MTDFNAGLTSPLSTSLVSGVIPSAARTTAVVDVLPKENLANCRGVILYLVVTAASGTGGLTMSVKAIPNVAASGGSTVGAASAAVIAIGTTTLMIYPTAGAASTYTTVVNNTVPPRFTVNVAVGDASSYTYAVHAYLLD